MFKIIVDFKNKGTTTWANLFLLDHWISPWKQVVPKWTQYLIPHVSFIHPTNTFEYYYA